MAKGSAINKAILVPAALAISAFAPWAVIPLLMLGGAFLCYEGFEKLAHRFMHTKSEDDAHHAQLAHAVADPAVDIVAFEKDKIKGAVRTDFILSAEIITIALGTVAQANFATQVTVLVGIAIIMTIGVYGLVAGIVKLDDAGLYLSRQAGRLSRAVGAAILKAAPYLMKTLSVAGTAAMFLVGGGILTHGLAALHHWSEGLARSAGRVAGVGGVLEAIAPLLFDAAAGIVAGAVVLGLVSLSQRVARSVRVGQ